MVEKTMHKDRWPIPVPAEMTKSIGLDLGKKFCAEVVDNKIIISNPENERIDFNNIIKAQVIKSTTIPAKTINLDVPIAKKKVKKKENKEYCYQCNKELSDDENLKVDGHRICKNCKKREVQKFLLYAERRRVLNEEEREKSESE